MNLAQMLLMARPLKLSYQQVILADHPVAYWPLNETSGTVANDLSGNGYIGAYEGGFTLNQSAPGGRAAVLLNGSSGYININPVPAVPPGTNGLAFECWVYANGFTGIGANGQPAIGLLDCNENGTAGYGLCIARLSGKGTWYWPVGGGDVYGTTTSATGAWQHIVVQQAANGDVQFYLNGQPDGTASTTYCNPGEGYFKIGHQGWTTSWLNGLICDVAYYNTTLTATQILNHYNAGIA